MPKLVRNKKFPISSTWESEVRCETYDYEKEVAWQDEAAIDKHYVKWVGISGSFRKNHLKWFLIIG